MHNHNHHHHHHHHDHPHIHSKHHSIPPAAHEHTPPRIHKGCFQYEFSEEDAAVFRDIFGSESTSTTAMNDILNVPSEVTVLGIIATQLAGSLRKLLIERGLDTASKYLNVPDDLTREDGVKQVEYDRSALGESAKHMLYCLYGEEWGNSYYEKLNRGTDEIATIARICAYIQEKVGELNEH